MRGAMLSSWACIAVLMLALCVCSTAASKASTTGAKQDTSCWPPESEVDALVLLYHRLGGVEWRKADNWLKGNPCGVGPRDSKNWIGVLCGPCRENVRHVEVLALEWNNLSGKLGDWIGKFPEMQVLNFGTNALSGEMPAAIGLLKQLRVLKLSYNRMEGKLPKELYAMSTLEMFDVVYNDFVGNVNDAFAAWPLLKIYNVRGNRGFGGDLTAAKSDIAKLTGLKVLDLHWNHIGGDLPAELFQLPKLEQLSMANNDISGSLPSTFACKSLRTLQLSDNYIEGPIPDAIGELTQLDVLDLEKNDLSGPLPASIGNLKKLTELRLRYNQLRGPLPNSLFTLPLVRHIISSLCT